MVEPMRWVETAAKALGVPLSIVDVAMKEARDLYQADLALIRPDQIVAWRGNSQRMFCVGLPDTSTLISALGENRRIGPGRVDV